MKKQVEVLIRTGKGRFIPIGNAEIELHTILADIGTNYIINKVELNRININVKKGDTIWERIKSHIYD